MTDRILMLCMAALLIGAICAYRYQRRKDEKRRQLERDINAAMDARTDRAIRAGMRTLTPHELLALLNDRLDYEAPPIMPHEFRVVPRLVDRISHGPTHFEDDKGAA